MTQKMEPLVAWRALRRLIADPEQTQEVFTIIRALSGPALENGYKKFVKTPVGERVMAEKVDLLDTLLDRETLAGLPADSLGRHYLGFVTRENISADGLVEASEENGEYQYLSDDVAHFGRRQRDMHDLWHTLTEYGRDELGEVCLLAFTYAQTKNRGIGVICLAGMFNLRPTFGWGVFKAAWRAYRDGKKAAWLPAADWENLLTLPIAEVRDELRIQPPARYLELHANAALA